MPGLCTTPSPRRPAMIIAAALGVAAMVAGGLSMNATLIAARQGAHVMAAASNAATPAATRSPAKPTATRSTAKPTTTRSTAKPTTTRSVTAYTRPQTPIRSVSSDDQRTATAAGTGD